MDISSFVNGLIYGYWKSFFVLNESNFNGVSVFSFKIYAYANRVFTLMLV